MSLRGRTKKHLNNHSQRLWTYPPSHQSRRPSSWPLEIDQYIIDKPCLRHTIMLTSVCQDVFTTTNSPWTFIGARGVYGGTKTAQCLVAAQHTVTSESLLVYSLHIGFLHPGNPKLPIEYHVERTRDGKNFATRTVRGFQGRQIIASATVSFASTVGATGREGGGMSFEHAKKMPVGLSLPDEAKLEWYKVDGPLELKRGDILNSLFLAPYLWLSTTFGYLGIGLTENKTDYLSAVY